MFYDWQEVTVDHVAGCLEFVCQLYSNPNNWIYWPTAVDLNGLEVEPTSPEAIKWSMIGATEKYAMENFPRPLADCIACATREFLNDLSDSNALLHGKLQYQDELELVKLGVEEIKNEKNS